MYEMDEKCRKCKNNGKAICNRCDMYYDEFDPIDEPKKTRADFIRGMSDEELSELFSDNDCGYCRIHDFCFAKGCQINCEDVWLDWLKQEVET